MEKEIEEEEGIEEEEKIDLEEEYNNSVCKRYVYVYV